MADRNPIIIPKEAPNRNGCPKCGGIKWFGRNIQGAVTFKCECGHVWYGGLPQLPQDPTIPFPPDVNEPIQFVENKKMEGGVEEIRKKLDLRTDFRKGAPIPEDGEE